MASRDTEGRREIEAAKKRLAAATAQASTAAQNVEAAKVMKASAQKTIVHAEEMKATARKAMEAAAKNMVSAKTGMKVARENADVAKSQLHSSQKEVEEAKRFLKEAEERWEVIDVDSDDDSQEKNGNSKRRKVSLSPAYLTASNRAARGQVERVTVEGCGKSKANGIYERDGEFKGAPKYTRVCFEGERAWFDVQRARSRSLNKFVWCISTTYGGRTGVLYVSSFADGDDLLPPTNGWTVYPAKGSLIQGLLPAPRLKLDYA